MFRVADLGHEVVNLSPLLGRDVRRGVVPLVHKLLEKWVHLSMESHSVQGTLHLPHSLLSFICQFQQFCPIEII